MIYIPIGTDCHPAGNLNSLKLRKFSLPFDWLFITEPNKIFEYLNNLISSQFAFFVKI